MASIFKKILCAGTEGSNKSFGPRRSYVAEALTGANKKLRHVVWVVTSEASASHLCAPVTPTRITAMS